MQLAFIPQKSEKRHLEDAIELDANSARAFVIEDNDFISHGNENLLNDLKHSVHENSVDVSGKILNQPILPHQLKNGLRKKQRASDLRSEIIPANQSLSQYSSRQSKKKKAKV